MDALKIDSPAKVNLFLKVLGKRRDGYHGLETVFHRISLRDTLIFKKSGSGFRLTCNLPSLPCGEKNLITRAFRLLQQKFPELDGVSVRLIKRIPLAAGLGGGSSNAAFFMLAMKKLFSLRLDQRSLCQIGTKLGSDVPFFLYRANQAIGTGRGEKITVCPAKKKLWFVLVTSPAGLSTREIYRAFDQKRHQGAVSLTNGRPVVKIASHFLESRETWQLACGLYNDLEKPAIGIQSTLRDTMGLMIQLGAPATAMSGSGPTLFAVFSNRKESFEFSRRLKQYLPSERITLCRTF